MNQTHLKSLECSNANILLFAFQVNCIIAQISNIWMRNDNFNLLLKHVYRALGGGFVYCLFESRLMNGTQLFIMTILLQFL